MITTHQTQKNTIQQQITQAQHDLAHAQKNYADIQQRRESMSKYFCTKIDGDCPFVEHINQKAIAQILAQEQTLSQECDRITKYIAQLQQPIKEPEYQPSDIIKRLVQQKIDLESQPALDMTEITMIENQLIESRKFFVLPRKDRQQKAIQHRTILDTIKNLSQDIITLQHKQSDYHNYFTIQTQLTTRKDLLTNQINDCDIKIADLDDHIQQIPQVNIEPIQKLVKLNAEIHRIIDRLKQYVDDYKVSRIQLNDLEQQLTITKNLYDVVSKDLMIHILQTKLPQIEMYINNNLTYVCDYQL